MILSFEKYQGLGNDFIFIDRSLLQVPLDPQAIQTLCDRHQGIGADGVVLVDLLPTAKMEIYNADGSLAEMCGNALRCLYLYLKKRNPFQERFEVRSMLRKHLLYAKEESIVCTLGKVGAIEWDISLEVKGQSLVGHFLDTGVPHFVLPVFELHHLPVLPLGAALRHHPYFQPKGTNVNFIALNKKKEVEIRTYERGVESETKACGTGCAAAAIVAKMLFNLKGEVIVKPSLGERLYFDFEFQNEHTCADSLIMRGGAQFVFEGLIELKNASKKVVLSPLNP